MVDEDRQIVMDFEKQSSRLGEELQHYLHLLDKDEEDEAKLTDYVRRAANRLHQIHEEIQERRQQNDVPKHYEEGRWKDIADLITERSQLLHAMKKAERRLERLAHKEREVADETREVLEKMDEHRKDAVASLERVKNGIKKAKKEALKEHTSAKTRAQGDSEAREDVEHWQQVVHHYDALIDRITEEEKRLEAWPSS